MPPCRPTFVDRLPRPPGHHPLATDARPVARPLPRGANQLLARSPPLVVLDPLRAPDPALFPLVALGPARQPELAVAELRRLPGLRIDPVGDHMDMGVPGVIVRDDQRLVALQPQRLQTPVHRAAHLPPVGRLVPRPAERIVQDRLRQLAPPSRRARQPFEVGGRLRGCGHQPRGPLPRIVARSRVSVHATRAEVSGLRSSAVGASCRHSFPSGESVVRIGLAEDIARIPVNRLPPLGFKRERSGSRGPASTDPRRPSDSTAAPSSPSSSRRADRAPSAVDPSSRSRTSA